ncbi:MAG TPA: methyltransferase domain-containing protein [Steroidobacteraceae bacterium]|nr:methyltransferase domain-containing protein [Steroidobacteraceae bacterium]
MPFNRRTTIACAMLGVLAAVAAWSATERPASDPALQTVLAGNWRSAEARSRDEWRHPGESLQFWGLQPGMSILEVQPGAGWWTDILAPYARMTGGRFAVTAADLNYPGLSDTARKGREELAAKFAGKPDLYGKVELVNWGRESAPLAPNQFDFILTARSVHGWMDPDGGGVVGKVFADFFRALKPGGILALEQHRADPGPQDPGADNGYVTEAYVIEQAQRAGFKLVERSEINANPRDTKDHPFGVWTLPPTRTSVPYGRGLPPDPKFDHSKYDAIGESDRMTLRFRKP